jgi:hypothetical protein
MTPKVASRSLPRLCVSEMISSDMTNSIAHAAKAREVSISRSETPRINKEGRAIILIAILLFFR